MTIRQFILNKKLFIGIVGLFSILCLVLLVMFVIFPEKKNSSDLLLEPFDSEYVNFPLEYYINKDTFTKDEIEIIKSSGKAWELKTNHFVKINFHDDWQPTEPFSSNYINYNKRTIWKIKSNDITILELQLRSSIIADGFTFRNGNLIIVIDDVVFPFNKSKLFTIMVHELGHQMGLGHIKDKYPAIMNIHGNNGNITKYDLMLFNNIYGQN